MSNNSELHYIGKTKLKSIGQIFLRNEKQKILLLNQFK